MEEEVKRLLDAFDGMRDEANVNACFGAPVEIDGRTVIPVARVGYGFGVGTGKVGASEEEASGHAFERVPTGGGGGGGATSTPIGYIAVSEDEVRVEPILDQQKLAVVSMLVGAWSVFWLSRALAAIFRPRD
jgi:uncharacterized spore protein YtfJ